REIEWLRRGPQARTTKQKARIQRAEAAIAVQAPEAQQSVMLQASAQRLGKTIVDLKNVSVELGGRRLIDGLTLNLAQGERLGVIGRNGVGKTTLLKLITKAIAPISGEVVIGQRTGISYFDQSRAELRDDWTVFDNVAEREDALLTGGITVAVGDSTLPLRSY